MLSFLSLCATFLVFLQPASSLDLKLSDSKILLPYFNHNPVNFTLHGSSGACYDWYSGTPEVATVTPIFNEGAECSNKAVIASVWQSLHRAVTTVYAKVQGTSYEFKCDVIVDKIHQITIETTTQELYLHNTPESLIVNALDEFGNTFSSLDGIPFDWRILGDDTGTANVDANVLRFLSWTESEYETPSAVMDLENKGMRGYTQLVSGLRTGSAVVSVALLDSPSVTPAHVRLLVMANAQLSPAIAYLMPHSRLTLKVHVIQQGHDQEITMPSNQYQLQVDKSDVVRLEDESGSTITALQTGQTQINLLDRNVEAALERVRASLDSSKSSASGAAASDDNPLLGLPRRRLPASLIQVVEPAYLEFSISHLTSNHHKGNGDCRAALLWSSTSGASSPPPQRSWSIEVGQRYAVRVDAFDRNGHKLWLTDNVRIDFRLDSNHFEMLESTENNTHFILRPLVATSSVLKASLKNLLNKSDQVVSLTNPISASQDVSVLPPISIQPSEHVILPWSGQPTDSALRFNASGGSGQFVWAVVPSAYPAVGKPTKQSLSVNQLGAVNVLDIGESLVIASSHVNRFICAAVKVSVRPPSQLKFLPGPAEVVVHDKEAGRDKLIDDNVLTIGLGVLDANLQTMTDCRSLGVGIRPLDASLVRILPGFLPPRSISQLANGSTSSLRECLRFSVVGVKVGFTELEAVYQLPGTSPAVVLSARFLVAVYRPIEFVDPASASTYVAVGSTRLIRVANGPQPWPNAPESDFYSNGLMLVAKDNINSVTGRKQPSTVGAIQVVRSPDSKRELRVKVRCESVGEFAYQIQLGNRPSLVNPLPLVMAADVVIVCDTASSLRLIPHLPLPVLPKEYPSCPITNGSLSNSSDEVLLPDTVPISISLVFYGMHGRELEAIDSIVASVSLLEPSLGNGPSDLVVDAKPNVITPQGDDAFLSFELQRPYVIVTPRILGQTAGVLHASALAKARKPSVYQSIASSGLRELSSTLPLRLIAPAHFDTQEDPIQLLNHPESELVLSLIDGSGHMYHQPTTSPFVSVEQHSSLSTSYRLKPSQLGNASLRFVDLCYPRLGDSLRPVELEIGVGIVNLQSLRLTVPDRIPLGDKVDAVVEAIDSSGRVLGLEFARLLPLNILDGFPDKRVVQLPASTSPGHAAWSESGANSGGEVLFNVHGLSLGSTHLSVSTWFAGKLVVSNKVDVQVFSRLQLSPCNFNLLLGSEFELRASGGPQPALLHFSIASSLNQGLEIVRVDRQSTSIIIRAVGPALGWASLEVSAASLSTSTQSPNVSGEQQFSGSENHPYSSASCPINVVALSAIRIASPLPEPAKLHDSTTNQRFLVECSSPSTSDSCGLVPLWLEGLASSASHNGSLLSISPMEMGFVEPKLDLEWQLESQPIGAARLQHWLEPLSVDVNEESPAPVSAGMMLKVLAPGRVIVRLTAKSAVPTFGQIRPHSAHLHAKLTFNILPKLGLVSPPMMSGSQQLLLTPNSHFQLLPRSDHLSNSLISYRLLDIDTQACTDGGHSHNRPTLSVSPDGFVLTNNVCSDRHLSSTCSCQRMIVVEMRPLMGDGDNNNNNNSSSPLLQTMFVRILIRPPQYATLAPSIVGDAGFIKASGLLVGGPYSFQVVYHDELGHVFDSVSEAYTLASIDSHRADQFDLQVGSTSTSNQKKKLVNVHALSSPRNPADVNSSPMPTSAKLFTVVRIQPSTQPATTLPTYFSLPYAGELNIPGLSGLALGQWICLPNLTIDGIWSSGDPSLALVEVDNDATVLLARRVGSTQLTYSLASSSSGPPTSYQVSVAIVDRQSPTALTHVGGEDQQSGEPILPIYSPSMVDSFDEHKLNSPIAFQVGYSDDDKPHQTSSCSPLPTQLSHLLASNSPLKCNLRFSAPVQHASTSSPVWLVQLLRGTAANTETNETLPIDMAKVLIEPIHGSWRCVVHPRLSFLGDENLVTSVGFHHQQQLIVDLIRSADNHVLASSAIQPLPGFRMLVPPPIAVASELTHYHLSISSVSELSRRLLIYLPSATESRDRLFARIKAESVSSEQTSSPLSVLTISDPLRPVSYLAEVSQAIVAYSRSQPLDYQGSSWSAYLGRSGQAGDPSTSLAAWQKMALEQVQLIDNEVDLESSLEFGRRSDVTDRRLIWTLEVTAAVGDSAVDTVIPVVVNLPGLGQHLTIPIHVRLPSRHDLSGHEYDQVTNQRDQSILNFYWLDLFYICCIGLAIAVILHLVVRASVSNASPGLKISQNLPGASSPLRSGGSSTLRRPWTQGGTALLTPPQASPVYPRNLAPERPNRSLLLSGSGDTLDRMWPNGSHRFDNSPPVNSF